jgi:hypothetical protein
MPPPDIGMVLKVDATYMLTQGVILVSLIWPFVNIGPQLFNCVLLYFVNRLKQMMHQPILSHTPIIALHIGTLLGLAELYRFCQNTSFRGPNLPMSD